MSRLGATEVEQRPREPLSWANNGVPLFPEDKRDPESDWESPMSWDMGEPTPD